MGNTVLSLAVSKRNVDTSRVERTPQDGLQKTVRCNLNDYGVVGNEAACLLKQHRAQQIVGVIFGARELCCS